LVLCLS